MSELDSIKKHVEHLSVTIGPRGSTKSGEIKAADYIEKVYRDFGLDPIIEPFTSAKSAWYPYALASGLVLLSEILYLFGYGYLSIILSIFALVSLVLELMFKSNPFRWILPTEESQNVSVRLEPTEEIKEKLVLIGHMDTHRTPIIYKSQRWIKGFSYLTTITFVSAIIILSIYILDFFIDTILLPLLSFAFSMPVLILYGIALSADRTEYTNGANDNATGTAMVIGLVERILKNPLQHTEVWGVNSGCEEVGAYGAADWVKHHIPEVQGGIYITLDNLGGKGCGPCFISKETLIFPFESDKNLLELANRIAEENPDLGAYSRQMRGAYTDGAIGAIGGLRCLTFVNYTPDGVIPDWHQLSDVYENVDWDTVQRTQEFVWKLIQMIDRKA